jgi:PAS domain-containing protein
MAGSKKVERNLYESERNFRLLVEGITDYAIYMLSPEGLITNWNKGAERIKGYKAREIVGKHFSVFYTPEDQVASPKAGAFARTAPVFSLRSSSIRSTKNASSLALPRSPVTSANVRTRFPSC